MLRGTGIRRSLKIDRGTRLGFLGVIKLSSYLRYVALAFSIIFSSAEVAAAGVDKLIVMGTGSPAGVFSRVGKGLCSLVNNKREQHLVRCISYNSGGSDFNVHSVLSNGMDFGMTSSDVAYMTFKSRDYSAKKLRLVAALYEMPTAVIIHSGSQINSLADVPGKSINKGNIGSGKRTTTNLIFKMKNWADSSFSKVFELGSAGAGEAFCSGKLQVMIDYLGNPSSFYQKIFNTCEGKLISFSEQFIGKIIAAHPYLNAQTIKAEHYGSITDDIKTFGSEALIVTRSDISDHTVYSFLKSIYSDVGGYKRIHPALGEPNLDISKLNATGIPLHNGGKRFFQGND